MMLSLATKTFRGHEEGEVDAEYIAMTTYGDIIRESLLQFKGSYISRESRRVEHGISINSDSCRIASRKIDTPEKHRFSRRTHTLIGSGSTMSKRGWKGTEPWTGSAHNLDVLRISSS